MADQRRRTTARTLNVDVNSAHFLIDVVHLKGTFTLFRLSPTVPLSTLLWVYDTLLATLPTWAVRACVLSVSNVSFDERTVHDHTAIHSHTHTAPTPPSVTTAMSLPLSCLQSLLPNPTCPPPASNCPSPYPPCLPPTLFHSPPPSSHSTPLPHPRLHPALDSTSSILPPRASTSSSTSARPTFTVTHSSSTSIPPTSATSSKHSRRQPPLCCFLRLCSLPRPTLLVVRRRLSCISHLCPLPPRRLFRLRSPYGAQCWLPRLRTCTRRSNGSQHRLSAAGQSASEAERRQKEKTRRKKGRRRRATLPNGEPTRRHTPSQPLHPPRPRQCPPHCPRHPPHLRPLRATIQA